MLNTIRVRFLRGEEVKYISHLDLMKVFERALRRAGIPIAYSQGFNPHPQMVFGLPLSVGVTSEAEYADFELSSDISVDEFAIRLNKQLPLGLKILNAGLKRTNNNIMASISAASYDILFSSYTVNDAAFINENIEKFLNQPAITVKKEGKRGVKDVEIRPMIYRLDYKDLNNSNKDINENNADGFLKAYIRKLSDEKILPASYRPENIFCISALLSAGSSANLKAELLASAFCDYIGNGIKLVKIHRTGLFLNRGNGLADPLAEE